MDFDGGIGSSGTVGGSGNVGGGSGSGGIGGGGDGGGGAAIVGLHLLCRCCTNPSTRPCTPTCYSADGT